MMRRICDMECMRITQVSHLLEHFRDPHRLMLILIMREGHYCPLARYCPGSLWCYIFDVCHMVFVMPFRMILWTCTVSVAICAKKSLYQQRYNGQYFCRYSEECCYWLWNLMLHFLLHSWCAIILEIAIFCHEANILRGQTKGQEDNLSPDGHTVKKSM
jgi:hypothetical protein